MLPVSCEPNVACVSVLSILRFSPTFIYQICCFSLLFPFSVRIPQYNRRYIFLIVTWKIPYICLIYLFHTCTGHIWSDYLYRIKPQQQSLLYLYSCRRFPSAFVVYFNGLVSISYFWDLFRGVVGVYAEADLEAACGACAPLKFAKHMLYNVIKEALVTILTKKLYVLEIGK